MPELEQPRFRERPAHELEAGGHAVVEFCPLSLKKQIDVWGDQPGGMEIMHRIKQEFAPLGIMSPGRFVGKI